MKDEVEAIHKGKQSSICWDCQNAYAHKCSWFKDYTPVKDWDAYYNAETGSYVVNKCPNFVPDVKKETAMAEAKRLGINIRTYFKRKNRSIFYDLKIK